ANEVRLVEVAAMGRDRGEVRLGIGAALEPRERALEALHPRVPLRRQPHVLGEERDRAPRAHAQLVDDRADAPRLLGAEPGQREAHPRMALERADAPLEQRRLEGLEARGHRRGLEDALAQERAVAAPERIEPDGVALERADGLAEERPGPPGGEAR